MGSALLDTAPLDLDFAEASGDSAVAQAAPRVTAPPASTEALRRQVAERLAEHRGRRPTTQLELSSAPSPSVPARARRIAAAVAQRYAHSPSYHAYLAAEAERATQQAQAAAQIAALNAQAVAQAQQQLLDSLNQGSRNQDQNDSPAQLPQELSLWPEVEPTPAALPAQHSRSTTNAGAPPSAIASSPKVGSTHLRAHPVHANSQPIAPTLPGLTVRLGEDAGALPVPMLGAEHRSLASFGANWQEDRNDDEARRLDEEIAFRQSPVFDEPLGPPMPLPANLIEFPRQLVAPRKARPRYAEGPLRAAGAAPADGQLRIFEVDPAQISTTPIPTEASAPQWTSLWLDAPGPEPAETADASQFELAQPAAVPSARPDPLPQIASIARRIMAAAIDAAVLFAGFLAFTAAFLLAANRSIPWHAAATVPTASLALVHHSALARLSTHAADQFTAYTGLQPSLAFTASVLVLAVLYLLYQALFFTFSASTPGMRCARIALCTFDDENPTRRAMRRRILAVLVSACPLGLGLLWAAFDEDRLAWHDRLTRTYQRTY